MVGKGGRVFRNKYKGHMDKTKWGWDQGWGVGLAAVSYTHLTLPTKQVQCRSRWAPSH